MRILRIAVALGIALQIQGCASLLARSDFMSDNVVDEPRDSFPTAIYPGVATDIAGAGVALSSPVSCMWSDAPWWMIVTTPLFVIDLPFSFVVDTVCLPSDISHWQSNSRHEKEGEGEPEGGGYSPSAGRPSKPIP